MRTFCAGAPACVRALVPAVSVLTILLLAVPAARAAAPREVGVLVPLSIESPHPYPAAEPGAGWERTITFPGATYIRLHFSRFELAPGDRVELVSPRRPAPVVYTGRGPRGSGEFWARTAPGDTVTVRLHAAVGGGGGIVIDSAGRGVVPVFEGGLAGEEDLSRSPGPGADPERRRAVRCGRGLDGGRFSGPLLRRAARRRAGAGGARPRVRRARLAGRAVLRSVPPRRIRPRARGGARPGRLLLRLHGLQGFRQRPVPLQLHLLPAERQRGRDRAPARLREQRVQREHLRHRGLGRRPICSRRRLARRSRLRPLRHDRRFERDPVPAARPPPAGPGRADLHPAPSRRGDHEALHRIRPGHRRPVPGRSARDRGTEPGHRLRLHVRHRQRLARRAGHLGRHRARGRHQPLGGLPEQRLADGRDPPAARARARRLLRRRSRARW